MAEFFTGPAPVEVAAGVTGDPIPFPELASAGPPPTIFLRVADLDASVGPRAAPTLTLHTDLGPPLDLTTDFASVLADDGTVVAAAATAADPDGTHRIRIIAEQLGTRWSLAITNPDATVHRYTGVVADTVDGTRRPWIDVPRGLSFSATLGEAQTRSFRATNSGTGPLRVEAPPGVHTTFTLTGVPAVAPPGGAADLAIVFTPDDPGSSTATFVVPSNDPAPLDAAGHNNLIRISATAIIPAPVVSGSTQLHGTVGTLVTITGRHFDVGGLVIRFGDRPAAEIASSDNGTVATCRVPVGTTGDVPVTLATAGSPAGRPITVGNFLFGETPAFGSPEFAYDGTFLTIFGSNLNAVTGVSVSDSDVAASVDVDIDTATARSDSEISFLLLPELVPGNRYWIGLDSRFGSVASTDRFEVPEI